MYLEAGTTDLLVLLGREEGPNGYVDFSRTMQLWLWLALFASFAVKVPMWPVHTWLPDAHVQAPTAGSVILAGVLLKMGGYGFLRFSIPMLPEATDFFTPLIYTLSVVAIVYTSLVAWAQENMKKLIAYSSIAHMGFATIGMFTLTTQGIQGSIFQMLSHGIVSAALFLLVGVVYDRLHSLDIDRYGGLVNNMPRYAVFFMLFALASVGLPGTSGFVGEMLSLVGAFLVNTWLAVLAATGIILGAIYMLQLYRRVVFGKITREDVRGMIDLTPREIGYFVPLIVMVMWMGIYPTSFLEVMDASVENLIENYRLALAESDALSVAER
jgi:NADH-quinone oxidoreductase subunit M